MRNLTPTTAATLTILLLDGSPACSQPPPKKQCPAEWSRPGIEWMVEVQQYARRWGLAPADPGMAKEAQIPKVAYEFHVRIAVLESRATKEERIVRLEFTPMDDAPDSIRDSKLVLELDADTGKPRTLIQESGHTGGSRSVVAAGEERVLFSAAYGLPVDWIVSGDDINRMPNGREKRSAIMDHSTVPLTKERRTSTVAQGAPPLCEIDASVDTADGTPDVRIVQFWSPGEGMWRSFRRYYHGHLDLTARRVDDGAK